MLFADSWISVFSLPTTEQELRAHLAAVAIQLSMSAAHTCPNRSIQTRVTISDPPSIFAEWRSSGDFVEPWLARLATRK